MKNVMTKTSFESKIHLKLQLGASGLDCGASMPADKKPKEPGMGFCLCCQSRGLRLAFYSYN